MAMALAPLLACRSLLPAAGQREAAQAWYQPLPLLCDEATLQDPGSTPLPWLAPLLLLPTLPLPLLLLPRTATRPPRTRARARRGCGRRCAKWPAARCAASWTACWASRPCLLLVAPVKLALRLALLPGQL